mmetsp:Transcript_58713/g.124652  ORF Transcript_58713/g.124652 Transcript_58713/m.124652 type:complete len:459 (-) Transcript_58713:313-1689(-)
MLRLSPLRRDSPGQGHVRRPPPKTGAGTVRERVDDRDHPQEVLQLRRLSHLLELQSGEHHRRHLAAGSEGGGRGQAQRVLQVREPRVRRAAQHHPLPCGRPARHQGAVLHTLLPLRKVRHGTDGSGGVAVLAKGADRGQVAAHHAGLVSVHQGCGGLGGFAAEHIEGEAAGHGARGEDEEGADEEAVVDFEQDDEEGNDQVQGRILQGVRLLPKGGDLSGPRVPGGPLQAPVLRDVQGHGRRARLVGRVRVAHAPGAEGNLLPLRAEQGAGAAEPVPGGILGRESGGDLHLLGDRRLRDGEPEEVRGEEPGQRGQERGRPPGKGRRKERRRKGRKGRGRGVLLFRQQTVDRGGQGILQLVPDHPLLQGLRMQDHPPPHLLPGRRHRQRVGRDETDDAHRGDAGGRGGGDAAAEADGGDQPEPRDHRGDSQVEGRRSGAGEGARGAGAGQLPGGGRTIG